MPCSTTPSEWVALGPVSAGQAGVRRLSRSRPFETWKMTWVEEELHEGASADLGVDAFEVAEEAARLPCEVPMPQASSYGVIVRAIEVSVVGVGVWGG